MPRKGEYTNRHATASSNLPGRARDIRVHRDYGRPGIESSFGGTTNGERESHTLRNWLLGLGTASVVGAVAGAILED
jgi:hypothetical protein